MDNNNWVWRKSFVCSGCMMEMTTALAISPDDTTVAAYTTENWREYFDRRGYFFTIRAADGHYIADAHRITHGVAGDGNLYVPPQGIHYDAYGIVYVAFSLHMDGRGFTNYDVDGEIEDYAAKFAIAGFNGATGAKIFYYH